MDPNKYSLYSDLAQIKICMSDVFYKPTPSYPREPAR